MSTGASVDHLFCDTRLAALYDLFCEGRNDFNFYLSWVMSAKSVLDVGCGTGALLHRAREAGHNGRLCGIDPALGMLEQARRRSDIEWIHGNLASARWTKEFDLVVMTGHAFQVLVEEDDVRTALTAIRSALSNDGRFVFETRNPLVREWERWTAADAAEVTDSDGTVVWLSRRVHAPVVGDRISFTHTFTSTSWEKPQYSQSTLRFLDAGTLLAFLSDSGLMIDKQFGDWNGQPLTATSPEIITVAGRA